MAPWVERYGGSMEYYLLVVPVRTSSYKVLRVPTS